MYEGINTFLIDKPKSTIDTVYLMNPEARKEDEYSNYYTMAMEYYQYNIIGAFIDGVPAFAVREDW